MQGQEPGADDGQTVRQARRRTGGAATEAEVAAVRWDFWRKRSDEHDRPDRPLPDDVGLPTRDRPPPASAAREDDEPSDDRAASAFSGAAPEAAASWSAAGGGTAWPVGVPLEPRPVAEELDPEQRAADRSAVVEAVRAVLDGDAAAWSTALAPLDQLPARAAHAGTVAGRALAARVPELSGVTGSGGSAEDEHDLRRAYAELLTERTEPLRARYAPDAARELLHALARTCAEGAPPSAGADARPDWPADGFAEPAAVQLRGLCVLLAQTCRDGAAGPDHLGAELERAEP